MKSASTRLALGACLLLAACGGAEESPIVGTQWRVESLGDKPGPFAGGNATIEFTNDGRVVAFAGCNRIGGEYMVMNSTLAISKLMSTKMACIGSTAMQDEQALSDALEHVTTVDVNGNKATLGSAGGTVAVLWRQ